MYKLKSATKNTTGVTLRLSADMIGTDKNNFPHNFLLANRQVASHCKDFSVKSSKDRTLSKTQLSNIIHSGGFLGKLLGQLMKISLLLMKNVLKLLEKSVLIPLRLTAIASGADVSIHQEVLGSGTTTLIISKETSTDILEIVKVKTLAY